LFIFSVQFLKKLFAELDGDQDWNCTGLIQWMQWTALLPGQSSRARFTCSMRDRNQSRGQRKGHLAVQIRAWYFKRPRPWTSTVSLCFIFFMQTSHFLARMARNIRSTVHNLHILHNCHNYHNNVKFVNLDVLAECVLNLHESERRKPKNWVPIAWLPIYDDAKSSKRPTQGYQSASARNMRLYHDCWRHILGRWKQKTEHARKVVYAGEICHQTRSYIGGLLGDQQVCFPQIIA